MGIFFRGREERRSLIVPWNVGAASQATVSQDRALALTPVFAANRHIADFVSTLPLKGYRKLGDERQPMDNLPQLFRDLEARGELMPWLSQAVSSVAIRGNAVGLITSIDGFGFPTAITWVSMDRVYVDDSSGVGKWFIDGKSVSRLDLVHIPWIKVPGQTLALSPIANFAATVNAGLDAQGYGAEWFKGGGFPPSVFKNEARSLPDGAADNIRERLKKALRKREPLVHGSDWSFTPISVTPNEAQFIESQKLTANQIAAIYGIAPEEVGGEPANSLTYANEEMRQTVRAHNVRPYLARFEHCFASILPDRQYVRFNVDGVMRADARSRAEIRESDKRIGFRTINEMRATEDLPPIEGGDVIPATQPQSEPRRLASVPDREAQ